MKKHSLTSLFQNQLDENQMSAVVGGDVTGICRCFCTCISSPTTNSSAEGSATFSNVQAVNNPVEEEPLPIIPK